VNLRKKVRSLAILFIISPQLSKLRRKIGLCLVTKKAKRAKKTHSAVFLKKTILKVKELVGKPDFTRREGQALVLQYQTDLCILDIFFYGENGTKVSTYFEFRPRTNIKINVQKCRNRMLTRKK
jgi:hypothetical protein